MRAWYLLCIFILPGCASMEYASRVKPDDFLYGKEYLQVSRNISNLSSASIEGIALKVGEDKTGFISPDRSDERLAFEKEFPAVAATDEEFERLAGHNNTVRAAQVIFFSADIDDRASGFLRDPLGAPLSVTGRFSVDSSSAISQGVMMGGVSGIASGAMAISSINNQVASQGLKLSPTGQSAVMGGNMASGLFAGFIAGAIHAGQAESTFNGFLESKSFGERMEHSTLTAAHVLGGASPLGTAGEWNTRTKSVLVTPGVAKRIFWAIGQKETNLRQRLFLISTVAVYRGGAYESKYPNTLGWEYRITNLNTLIAPSGFFSSDPEERYISLKRAITEAKVVL